MIFPPASNRRGPNPSWRHTARPRLGFTLVELMVVIAIIAVLTGSVVVAMFGLAQDAKADRTRTQIARLHTILGEKWEGYVGRRVPINLDPDLQRRLIDPTAAPGSPADMANRVRIRQPQQIKLSVLRELMRMELPDRKTDLLDGALLTYVMQTLNGPLNVAGMQRVNKWEAYRRRVSRTLSPPPAAPAPPPWPTWTQDYEGAECLYLILAETTFNDQSALSAFRNGEIGDLDGDKMPEILDGWGNPIEFLRWAPGFVRPNHLSMIQTSGNQTSSFEAQASGTQDRFDTRGVDPDAKYNGLLFPLVYSAGPDKIYDLIRDTPANDLRYVNPPPASGSSGQTNLLNDPYLVFDRTLTVSSSGTTADFPWRIGQFATPAYNSAGDIILDSSGQPVPAGHLSDNLHNHLIEVR